MAEKKMELRLINPAENEFLQHIDWNMDEIRGQVAAMMETYTDMVYTPDTMKLAKEDRAKLNKFVKIVEDKRKEIKKKWLEPYNRFEAEIKSVLELIQGPIGMIDGQIKNFENQQKEEKRKKLQDVYQENIGNLGEILPFDKIFNQRFLNATYDFDKTAGEIKASIEKVETDLATIDGLDSKYKLNVKDVYVRTLDLSKAMAENTRLKALEEKLEAERKAKEEAEKRRIAEAEAKAKAEEERRQAEAAAKKAAAEKAKAEAEAAAAARAAVNNSPENVIKEPENGTKEAESGTNPPESVEKALENVSQQAEVIPPTADGAQYEAFNVFAPKARMVVAPALTERIQEAQKAPAAPAGKKYRATFWVEGNLEQIKALREYLIQNGIKFGKVAK